MLVCIYFTKNMFLITFSHLIIAICTFSLLPAEQRRTVINAAPPLVLCQVPVYCFNNNFFTRKPAIANVIHYLRFLQVSCKVSVCIALLDISIHLIVLCYSFSAMVGVAIGIRVYWLHQQYLVCEAPASPIKPASCKLGVCMKLCWTYPST